MLNWFYYPSPIDLLDLLNILYPSTLLVIHSIYILYTIRLIYSIGSSRSITSIHSNFALHSPEPTALLHISPTSRQILKKITVKL